MSGSAEPGDDTVVVRQTWWKRAGVWIGMSIAGQGIAGLVGTLPNWFALTMFGTGVVVAVLGWRQGVRVTDSGIETFRTTRRDRRAAWDDIERFERNRAVLHDGTSITLFDWQGDDEAVRARLEAEWAARQLTPHDEHG